MPPPTLPPPPFDTSLDAIDQLRSVGREFHGRGWSLGTSSNYSVVSTRTPLELTITVSGKDKSALGRDDFVRVNAAGAPCDGSGRKSSAETLLHCLIAELVPSVGAVLHTHSVWSTILSRADLPRGAVRIEGYEMLKGLDGIVTHDTFEEVPVFANAQDMQELAAQIRARFQAADWSDPKRPPFHGFLLSGHGLYTWGRDLAEARRQIEIHEFLFEVVARTRTFAVAGVATTPIAPAASVLPQSFQPQSIQVGTERTVPAAARQQQSAQHQQ